MDKSKRIFYSSVLIIGLLINLLMTNSVFAIEKLVFADKMQWSWYGGDFGSYMDCPLLTVDPYPSAPYLAKAQQMRDAGVDVWVHIIYLYEGLGDFQNTLDGVGGTGTGLKVVPVIYSLMETMNKGYSASYIAEKLTQLNSIMENNSVALKLNGRNVILEYSGFVDPNGYQAIWTALGSTERNKMYWVDSTYYLYNDPYPASHWNDSYIQSRLQYVDDEFFWGGMYTSADTVWASLLSASIRTHAPGVPIISQLWPGYYRPEGIGGFINHRGTLLFKNFWDSRMTTDPNWIILESWDDYSENTMYEPTVNNRGVYASLVKIYIANWKGQQINFPQELWIGTPQEAYNGDQMYVEAVELNNPTSTRQIKIKVTNQITSDVVYETSVISAVSDAGGNVRRYGAWIPQNIMSQLAAGTKLVTTVDINENGRKLLVRGRLTDINSTPHYSGETQKYVYRFNRADLLVTNKLRDDFSESLDGRWYVAEPSATSIYTSNGSLVVADYKTETGEGAHLLSNNSIAFSEDTLGVRVTVRKQNACSTTIPQLIKVGFTEKAYMLYSSFNGLTGNIDSQLIRFYVDGVEVWNSGNVPGLVANGDYFGFLLEDVGRGLEEKKFGWELVKSSDGGQTWDMLIPGASMGEFDSPDLEFSDRLYLGLMNAAGGESGAVAVFDDFSCDALTDPAPPGQAGSPSPSNSATDVSITADLSWTAGSDANSHNIYFGTDSTPDETEYKGYQSGITYDPGALAYGTTYYWRIDEVGLGGTTTGTVWSFTTITTPPTFVVAGAVTSGTGAITPALPTGRTTGDILLLFLETANQAVSITNQNGGTWTEVVNSPQGTGTAGSTSATRLTVFWSRYNGTQGAPTTSDSGDHQAGRIIAIRGAAASGNPWDVTAGGVEGTADTSGSIPGATTTVTNTLVITAITTALPDSTSTTNFSSWTNANLTGITERIDNAQSAGNGGAIGVAMGVRAATGAYGNTTVTTPSAYKGMMNIAIKP